MFNRKDFTGVEIKDGEDTTRPPYPEELDQMVEAANHKLKVSQCQHKNRLFGADASYFYCADCQQHVKMVMKRR